MHLPRDDKKVALTIAADPKTMRWQTAMLIPKRSPHAKEIVVLVLLLLLLLLMVEAGLNAGTLETA